MRNIHSWVLSYLVDYHDIFRGQSKPSFCQDIFLSIRWKWYQWFNFLIWNQTAWPLYWPEIWLYFTVCIRWLLVPGLFTWVCCIYHIEWNRLSIYTIYNYEVLYLYVIFVWSFDQSCNTWSTWIFYKTLADYNHGQYIRDKLYFSCEIAHYGKSSISIF